MLFDEVIVAVAHNSAKTTLFDLAARLEFAQDAVRELPTVRVEVVDGLIAQFCRDHGADALVRGVRSAGDVDSELAMAAMNHQVSGVDTVFLPARGEHGFLASSLVKDVARHGGDISTFVTPMVAHALVNRFNITR